MNELAAAIAAQYKRQQELMAKRDEGLSVVADNLRGKVPDDLLWALGDAVHSFYFASIDETAKTIKILEKVRDTSAEGGEL